MAIIAIAYNNTSEKCQRLLLQLADYIQRQGGQLLHNDGAPGFLVTELNRHDLRSCTAVICLGGDGTLLAAVRQLAPLGVPLFGVNMGRVGFLSAVEKDGAFAAVDRLLAGDYCIQERMMLNCRLKRNGQVITECSAFNDIVVSSGINSRAVTLDLSIDCERITSYNADGIIVATPTGSTGYSLSAGGPIVVEDMDIMLITPVCPHSFFSRSIVASALSEVEIINGSASQAASLTADGQFRFALEKEDEIAISAAAYKARIIRFAGGSGYFERIKNKLYRMD